MNYPNNPTGATAPLAFYERLARARARARLPGLLGRGVQRALVRRAAALGARAGRPVERRRLPDALEALVDDRLPLRLRRGAAGDRLGAQDVPARRGTAPQEFVQRASVVAWSDEAHVERDARARTAASATCSSRCSRAKGWRVAASEATMYLWVEVPGGETSEASPSGCSQHGVVVAPGSYLRRRRRGLRPDRARPDARGVRARGRRSSRRCCERRRGDDRRARPRRDPRRREASAASGSSTRRRRRRSSTTSACGKMEPIEVGPFEYHDKIPLKRDYAALGVRVVPPAVARYGSFLSRGRRDDAELREHRRLGRAAHDGRHVGDRRLVRADRRRRPPRRRRRHRRRARAGATRGP